MLIQRGREVQCEKDVNSAAKHECEELKEGVWVEPTLVMQKKEVERVVDEQAPQRDEEVGDGVGWVPKRLHDIEWSDDKMRRGCGMEEGTEKHRLHHCPEWKEVRTQRPEELRSWEQRGQPSKENWQWQGSHPLSKCDRREGHLRIDKWQSSKRREW